MASFDFIQRAYIAFFNRPADRAGYDYWRSYSGSDQDLLDQFSQSVEYLSDFAGKNHRQTIGIIYQNLFGRPPEKAGWDYWTSQMDAGWVTVGNAAYEILGGAQGTDLVTINYKVDTAQSFTSALDTTPEIDAYAKAGTNGAGHIAKDWLATVNYSGGHASALNQLDGVLDMLLDANHYIPPPLEPPFREVTKILSDSDLEFLFPAACQYWLDVGVKAEQLKGIKFDTGSLMEYGWDTLAIASGKQITFSFAGLDWVWFVDKTPYHHEEFGSGSAYTGFEALPGSAADGNIDVLSVFIHEIGHVIGLGHDKLLSNYDVMSPALYTGTRLLPVPGNLANIGKLTTANPLTMDDLLESWMAEGDEANAWHDDILTSREALDTVQLVGYVDIGQEMDSQIVGSLNA